MKLKTQTQILQCMLAVNLNVNIWSARRKLNPGDFVHSELPPESLASLGSKKIYDPKALRIFTTLKARAVSLLDKSGVRFLGGWAIAEDKVTEIVDALEQVADEFQKAKDNFIKNYDKAVQGWISENPGWEQIIANSVVNADYVAKRIAFSWQVFKVINPVAKQQAKIESGLKNEVKNLGNTLFDEVAKAAKEALHKSYTGKSMVTRKALSPLKNIRQKLHDLSFIEPRVAPVASLIQVALEKIPRTGAINGTNLMMLNGLLTLLNDTSALTSYAQEILDGRSNESVLECLFKPDKPKSQPKSIKPVAVQESNHLESLGLW